MKKESGAFAGKNAGFSAVRAAVVGTILSRTQASIYKTLNLKLLWYFFILLLATTSHLGFEPAAGEELPKPYSPPFLERENVFEFTKKPAMKLLGDGKYEISFAVKGFCDATVAVLNEHGRIVRHLASGVLGKNAPRPFQQGVLSQRIEWDGKDDAGQPVPDGWRLRVSLGAQPEFDRLIPIEPVSFFTRGIPAMTVDESGLLWVVQGISFVRTASAPQALAFRPDGSYVRTIVPFNAALSRDRIPHVKFRDGPLGPVPIREFSNMLPGLQKVHRHDPLIRGEHMILVSGDNCPPKPGESSGAGRRLLKIGLDGSTGPDFFGPRFPRGTRRSSRFFLTMAPDGETIYAAGFTSIVSNTEKIADTIWRARWADEEFKPFAGPKLRAESEGMVLKDPRGLAFDPLGRLVVCDYQSDRLVVLTLDGSLVKTLPIRGPEQVLIHPKSGRLYVLSIEDRDKIGPHGNATVEIKTKKALVAFASVEDFKERARLSFPEAPVYVHDYGPNVALDATGDVPHIWASGVGPQGSDGFLWRIRDRGDALEKLDVNFPRHYSPFGHESGGLAADPATGDVYFAGRTTPDVLRIDGRTGERIAMDAVTEVLYGGRQVPYLRFPRKVSAVAVATNGDFYIRLMGNFGDRDKENWIMRFTRDGKPIPFADGDKMEVRATSHGYHNGSMGVAPNGDIYVLSMASDEQRKTVGWNHNVLNIHGSDGRLKQAEAIPHISAGVWGVRFDRTGRMYLTDSVRPKGQTGDIGSLLCLNGTDARWTYGTPAGETDWEMGRRDKPPIAVKIEGAAWIHYGVSPVPFGHCTCPTAPFDLDGFDRIAAVDDANCNVKLIDSNGNLILRFGQYANWDSQGPDSPVPMPALPLASANLIACAQDFVTVFDKLNNRLLRARIRYAAEETVKGKE
jgi:DNA-binding beta-propeller fold protein YncE